MKDSFGRTIDYLRISLTDKCNLRCVYCMPPEGITHVSHDEILSFEEIVRIVRVMAGLGLKKIRLTGGEPLVRRGIVDLIKKLNQIGGIEEISLTTNGILLSEYARPLKEAGIKSVNVSLDTLDEEVFRKIANPPEKPLASSQPNNIFSVKNILNGIRTALDAGLKVKINCVPCRAYNESELEQIALLAENLPVDVRFIEVMPVGLGKNFSAIPSDEILKRLENSFGKAKKNHQSAHSPAFTVHFKDFSGNVGFISPLSHSFCSECNRIRLTTEGVLKLCLCYSDGIDLKKILRSGAGDDTLKNEIIKAVEKKPRAHSFCGKSDSTSDAENENNSEKHIMAQIGG